MECPTWHEYAAITGVVRVEMRKVGIGELFDAYMPDGTVLTCADLDHIRSESNRAQCWRIDVLAKPERIEV